MTGEITLRGEVLPIGGLKEKLLAAGRGGIKTVLIPEENVKDLAEIPDEIKNRLDIHPVRWIEQVLEAGARSASPTPLPDDEAEGPNLPRFRRLPPADDRPRSSSTERSVATQRWPDARVSSAQRLCAWPRARSRTYVARRLDTRKTRGL